MCSVALLPALAVMASLLNFLLTVAASLLFIASLAAADTTGPNACPVDRLKQLNITTHGRLHLNTPFALPCFSSYNGKAVEPDADACAAVQKNYWSPAFRTEFPGAYMNEQDSMCSSEPMDQCVLDNEDPTDPLGYEGKDCLQGNVPKWYLEVQSASDVQAAFSFSKATGTLLSIKNSGHDYLSRSSQQGSLALWTRKLQHLEYHDAFVPDGCPSDEKVRAITTGAGVNCGEAYEFAEQNNVTILCGYSETVGISGGWVQAGGHSVLSNVYGLGIDRVLQYKLVTPEGHYRIANRCQNQALFWALRGGGGGTFGVVLESTHLVEPSLSLVVVDMSFKSNLTTLLDFYQILVEEALPWANDGWGGHLIGSSVVHVNPLLTVEEAKKSTKRAAAYVVAQGGTVTYTQYDSFYPFFEKYIRGGAVTVGNVHLAGSRLIPTAVLDNPDGQQAILGFIKDFVSKGGSLYVPVASPHLYKPSSTNLTSATPAWYTTLWELGAGGTWAWNSTLKQRIEAVDRLDNSTAVLESITPNSGAYTNEANPFTENWQEAWWGHENYASLLAIKQRYDPDGLLRCWRCVGWDDGDVADSCFKAFNN